jgi:sigma-B regulation protein RsbU (phosphoserine phosphatase)
MGIFKRAGGFLRDYTEGVRPAEMQSILGRDARRAFDILTRDHPETAAPRSRVGRWWDRAKRLFLGLSSRLSPPRRILFGVALLLAFVGLQGQEVSFADHTVQVNSSPLLLLLSIASLVLLLVLELADRTVVRDELEVARQLQRELIAEHPPALPGWGFAFSYQTANTIGGDYYELLPLDDGRLLVAAGDASGHGIAAGLVMAVANATLKLAADTDPDPVYVARMVNGALFRTGGQRAFMTLFCAVLQPDTGALVSVCAGHPFPVLRRLDGSCEELGSGSLPLGFREEVPLTSATETVAVGDAVVIYSDGIPEQINAAGEAFGFDRLRDAIPGGSDAQAIHDAIMNAVEAFAAGEPAQDDRSLVVITRHA